MCNPSGDDQKDTGRPADRWLARPARTGFQVLVIWTLLAVGFSEPFFFCLGFLASRLDRFCSLFATTSSLYIFGSNYAASAPRYNRQIKADPSTSLPEQKRRQGERSCQGTG